MTDGRRKSKVLGENMAFLSCRLGGRFEQKLCIRRAFLADQEKKGLQKEPGDRSASLLSGEGCLFREGMLADFPPFKIMI